MYDDRRGRQEDARFRDDYRDDRRQRDYSRDYDRREPRSRSPRSREYRQRSRSRSPRRDAGRPTDTVILEGIPFGLYVNELRESLLNHSILAELPSVDIRLSNSRGARRAFIQFESVEDAMAFVKEHYPKLSFDMQHSTDEAPDGRVEAYLHYARNRDGREDGDFRTAGVNWTCASCDFSNYPTRNKCKICGAPPSAPSMLQQPLTGLTDASDTVSQILVVYPLPPFINEDMLAGDMKRLELEKPAADKEKSDGAPKLKSTAPSGNPTGYGARPDSLHRVFLMRDTTSNESFKYGFAEFWTLEDASAAVAKFKMARNFTVAACAVTVAGTHMGVFTPEEREITPNIEHMSFNPLFNPAVRVRYRDFRAYPSQQIVTSQPPGEDKAKQAEVEDAKKSKKRKADGAAGANASKKSAPMAGQMAMWQKKHSELQVGEGQPGAESASKPDTKGPITISISKSRKLDGPTPAADGAGVGTPDVEDGTRSTDDAQVSFVDRERLMCLICMRKYKSTDEVDIHEKSRNHKTAMENEELVTAAKARIAARNNKKSQRQSPENDKDADTAATADASTSQYRDRAKERRQAFNQPQKPTPGSSSKSDKSNQPYEKNNTSSSAASSSTPAEAKPPAASKGAGMLAKMGWTTGAGLGANEDGRTEAIATNAYQEGVGLGAEGSNLGDAARLAERKTKNSYKEYVSTVQDKARERYEKMGQGQGQ